MAELDDSVRRRIRRLWHVPPLALLIGLGLTPLFVLFPRLPGGSKHDPALPLVALWLGTALLGGLAGTVDGAARPLYRSAAVVLAASLLSIPVMRFTLRSGLPFPHTLGTLLGLDGEHSMDAELYEIWLASWLVCLGLVLLVWHGLARFQRALATARHPSGPG